jgi:hypothetical protein
LTENEISQEEFQHTVSELASAGILDSIYEIVYIEIDQMLRHQTVPKFWSYFQPNTSKDQSNVENGFEKFQYAVKELVVEYKKFISILKTLEAIKQIHVFRNSDLNAQDDFLIFNEMFKSSLLSQLPVKYFNDVVSEFYVKSFKVFTHTHSDRGE